MTDMNSMPTLRIWGIIDVFILLSIVLLASFDDGRATAAQTAESLENEKAAARDVLKSLRSSLNRKDDKLNSTELELKKLESRYEELLKQQKPPFNKEKAHEEFKKLRNMIEVVEVELDGHNLARVGDRTFADGEHDLILPNFRPELGVAWENVNEGSLKEAINEITDHMKVKGRGRILIMLMYSEDTGEGLRDFFKTALNHELEGKNFDAVLSGWVLKTVVGR